MSRFLWTTASWLIFIALVFIGVREISGAPNQFRWEVGVSWLQWIGIPLFCFTAASAIATFNIAKWFLDRRYAHDLQRQVRQNLTPGAFREKDAADALLYLLNHSAWAYRQYARLNYWGMVDGTHLREFARAAEAGEIITLGWSGGQGKTVIIDRRYWLDGRIDEKTAHSHGAARMEIRTPSGSITFAQLAMAEADLLLVWPKASVARRIWATGWVLAKGVWFRTKIGQKIGDWRHARRR